MAPFFFSVPCCRSNAATISALTISFRTWIRFNRNISGGSMLQTIRERLTGWFAVVILGLIALTLV
ncbi:MAG: hypothetical protein WBM54_13475, partial [Woeseia sp.]